jgi:hypothetical protein
MIGANDQLELHWEKVPTNCGYDFDCENCGHECGEDKSLFIKVGDSLDKPN